jgi:hypothetical protein
MLLITYWSSPIKKGCGRGWSLVLNHPLRASSTETSRARKRCEKQGTHNGVGRFLEQLGHVRFEGITILLEEVCSLIYNLRRREEGGGRKRTIA